MLKYILKNAIRHLVHRKVFTLLNILGFTLAFSTSLIIFCYVNFENSFDNFHIKTKSVYRLEPGNQVIYKGTTGQLLQSKLPSIISACTISPYAGQILSRTDGETNTYSGKIYQADSALTKLFTFDVIMGDIEQALIDKSKIAITQKAAIQLFGSSDVLGKSVSVNYNKSLKVCAIYKEFPSNSTMRPIAFYSIKNNASRLERSESSFLTFLEIDPSNVNAGLVKQITSIIKEEFDEDPEIYLRQLSQIHFAEKVYYEYAKVTQKSTVTLFLYIAFLILIISVINYYNFKCGLLPSREKNFFVQGVNGANIKDVKLVLLSESLIMCFISALLAILIVEVLSGSQISKLLPFELNEIPIINKVVLLLFISISTALIASFLPSGFSFRNSLIERYSKTKSRSFVTVRGILMTFQFLASLVLIISTIIIYKQKQYLFAYDTGINSNKVITFPVSNHIVKNNESFSSELKSHAQITDVTYAAHGPRNNMMGWGRNIDDQQTNYFVWPVASNFIDFFDIDILKGRSYGTFESDKNTFIFNQTAIEKYNWQHKLDTKFPGFGFEADMIGICEDFNYASLHRPIEPMCFWLNEDRCNLAFVRYSHNLPAVIKFIKSSLEKLSPGLHFNYSFVDDTYQQYYKSEIRLFKLITFFSIVALIITAIGIIGLVTIITQRHVKEIGIRKANGAQTGEIILYLNKKISHTILIAFIVSVPLVWYFMQVWLNNFTQHIALQWYYFAFGGISVWALATLVTLHQTWKSAVQNPIKCLRYE